MKKQFYLKEENSIYSWQVNSILTSEHVWVFIHPFMKFDSQFPTLGIVVSYVCP